MQPERHRARRYPFQAHLELTDVELETQMRERTTDLSLFGCHVSTVKPWAQGARVSVKISHAGETFRALGRVAYSRPGGGMGIVFMNIQPNDQLVLEDWIADLRTK